MTGVNILSTRIYDNYLGVILNDNTLQLINYQSASAPPYSADYSVPIAN